MEGTQASDFPRFKDGDTLIVLTTSRTFQLHSNVLRRHSETFAHLLAEESGLYLTPKAKKDGMVLRYRLDYTKSSGAIYGQFRRGEVKSNGETAGLSTLIPELDNGKVANADIQCWQWLFGTFYSRSPAFDDRNLATVLQGCMSLTDVAEIVGAIDLVREFVELALLRQGQILFIAIATDPRVWAKLGRRIRSPTIYKEAVIHIVGKWQLYTDDEKRMDFDEATSILCDGKYRQLDEAKKVIDLRMLGHYPPFLCRYASDNPGRPSYANDIYMWMTVCFFRQWFAQAISDARNRLSPDGGYDFYTALGKGGSAYLNHQAFQDFHQYFPMSAKGCNVLEANMGVMKEEIKPFVAELVKNRSQLDVVAHPVSWLTCTSFGKDDFPWQMSDDQFQKLDQVGINPHADNQVQNHTSRRASKKRRRTLVPDDESMEEFVTIGERRGSLRTNGVNSDESTDAFQVSDQISVSPTRLGHISAPGI